MESITEKQAAFLNKRNVNTNGMTKAEAHTMISEIMGNGNITPSAEKVGSYEKNGQPVQTPQTPQTKYMHTPKDASIIAQTMMKCFYYNNKAQDLDAILNTYDYFLGELSK